ncbi:unnamed protein product, partial [Callosobruchus maculatus]
MVRSTCQIRLFRRPEKNHIYYMFVHPADLTHYHWSIQKERDRQLVFPRHLDLDTIPKNSES